MRQEKKYLDRGEIKTLFNQQEEKREDEGILLEGDDLERISNIHSYDEIVSPDEKEELKKWWEKDKNRESFNFQNFREEKTKRSVDLRFRDTPIKNQFGGTCTTFAMVGSMENLINKPTTAHLSERHLWSRYQRAYVSLAFKAALKYKITEERYWPEKNKKPYKGYLNHAHTRLTEYSKLYGSLKGTLRGLRKGYPAYIAMRVPKDMSYCRKVIRGNSPLMSGAGHAIAIVGYVIDSDIDGGGYFILKNSWGTKCGDKGYQYLSFKQCMNNNTGCLFYLIKGVESDYL